jgi:hypothetical protein
MSFSASPQRVDRCFGHEREFRFNSVTLGFQVALSVRLQLSFSVLISSVSGLSARFTAAVITSELI